MSNVVFVAPFFLETTLRFVEAVATLPDVRLGLVSQEPVDNLPSGLRAKLSAHDRIENALEVDNLEPAVRGLGVRMGSVDRVLGVLEHLQVQLAQVRASLGLPGVDVETARNFRDKARMKTALRAAGLPCARHRLATTAAEARAFAEEVGFPLVIKPPAGAGATGTHRLQASSDLEEALALYQPRSEAPVLLEEFVSGEEHSFDSILVGGVPAWCSFSTYRPSPLEVLENSWIQWCVFLPREIDRPPFEGFRELGFSAARALGLETGLSHMEWFDRGDGRYAISEVGARPPGARITTLLSYAHDHDFYRAWARLMVHDEFDPPSRSFAAGAAYLRAQGRGRVRAIEGLEQAQAELGDLVVESRLPVLGQLKADSYEGEGYVILRHPETSVVDAGLRRLVSLIRVRAG